ncbi:MAG: DUF4382 domain-containing protein [candidate division Zixibacteria bacterium]|nr:DUF4382 domain-containing protein [candidate division Zixibacteria bacterium]
MKGVMVMRILNVLGGILMLAAVLLMSGCSDSPNASGQLGELKIRLADSPGDYDQVNIIVTRVDVHLADADSSSGWATINDTPATYDLLVLRNGANAILGNAQLAPGQYTQIRLIIGEGSTVVVDSVSYPLDIPSGFQTGVKLNHGFTIEGGRLYELMLDFDADRSIHETGSHQYKLQPVIRVQAVTTSGSISGLIAPIVSRALVSTVLGTDTVSTVADTLTGAFELIALPAGLYDFSIVPTDTLYADTTITAVQVVAQQNTDLGTITLRTR